MLAQFIANGLLAGGVYALVAVGFAIMYNASRIFDLSYGVLFTWSAYFFYTLNGVLGLPLVPSALLAALLTCLFSTIIQLGLYRPLRRRGASGPTFIVVSMGLLIVFSNLAALLFTNQTMVLRSGPLQSMSLFGVHFTSLHIAMILTVLVIFPLLQLFFTRTTLGVTLRALSHNPTLATAVGIEVDRMLVIAYMLGSVLVSIASILLGYDLGVRPESGLGSILAAAVSVIIGGVGYLPGAAVGGFILGLVQNVTLWQIPGRWQDAITFAILVVMLILRPDGIFGRRLAVRRV